MKNLLETIVKSIVNNPDSVSIDEKQSVDFPGLSILTVTVDPSDLGVLIGKKGRTINSIRDIITIAAIRTNARVKVIVNEGDKPREEREEDNKMEDNKIDEALDL